ncbi:thiamine phosphate synthase [Sphingosinicella sp. BN140058]|uniref:thiamine phosphate synthase n=1 Tax=Sphingosinicella sp. BN140058 TaxID=1892855 RepID=UPI00352B3D77
MTDERQGETLWDALEHLPRGAGVIFRHYGLPVEARRRLFLAVRGVARRRRLILVVAGPLPLRGDGNHGRRGHGLRTAPAHDLKQIRAAERGGADLVFLSPVFPTRSHPGRPALGRVRFGLLARQCRVPVIALGGVTPRLADGLKALGAFGWAAIDAWGAGAGPCRDAIRSGRRFRCRRPGCHAVDRSPAPGDRAGTCTGRRR